MVAKIFNRNEVRGNAFALAHPWDSWPVRMFRYPPQLSGKPSGHCFSAPRAGNSWGTDGKACCLPAWAQNHTFLGAQGQESCP